MMNSTLQSAAALDQEDPLNHLRGMFHIPTKRDGQPFTYLCGNSLGLQPKLTGTYLQEVLEDWKNLGVEGHTQAQKPWMPYHEFLTV